MVFMKKDTEKVVIYSYINKPNKQTSTQEESGIERKIRPMLELCYWMFIYIYIYCDTLFQIGLIRLCLINIHWKWSIPANIAREINSKWHHWNTIDWINHLFEDINWDFSLELASLPATQYYYYEMMKWWNDLIGLNQAKTCKCSCFHCSCNAIN